MADYRTTALAVVLVTKGDVLPLVDPMLLQVTGVVPPDWTGELERRPTEIPGIAVRFSNGIQIQAHDNIVAFQQDFKPPRNSAVGTIADVVPVVKRFVATFPGLTYVAVGVNPIAVRSMVSTANFRIAKVMRTNGLSLSWRSAVPDVQMTLSYRFEAFNVNVVVRELASRSEVASELEFRGNIHRDVTEGNVTSTFVPDTLDHIRGDLDEFEALTGRLKVGIEQA